MKKQIMSSMVREIDPVVRAALTAMFGIVVHFGTVWTMEDHIIYSFSSSSSCISDNDNNITSNQHHTSNSISTFSPSLLLQILFLHEYWIYLQHMNVLANPLLQHLDRRYGIALLKSKKHWVIAGTLSAYWTRESLGMFLCLPYLMPTSSNSSSSSSSSLLLFMQDGNNSNNNFSMTQYLILYSLLYHTYKSRGVRKDASQYASSRLGIMTLVIDEFYVHNVHEILLSAFRLLLQGSDTFIHYCIVRDLLATLYFSSSFTSSSSTSIFLHGDKHETWNGNNGGDDGSGEPAASYLAMVTRMHILFVIWMIHAALNQLFRCSTASLMVMWWQSLTKSRSGMKSTTDVAKADDGGCEMDEHSLHEQCENRGVVDMEGECVPDRTRSVSSSNCSRVSTSSSGDDVDEDNDDYQTRRDSSSTSSGCGASGTGQDCYNVQTRREDFIVRQLLLPNNMITTGNKASCNLGCTIVAGSSAAVDSAVQLSKAIAALSAFFMLGLRQVPLKALPLAMTTTSVRKLAAHDKFRDENWLLVIVGLVQDRRRMFVFLAMHSWLLWSLLHAMRAIVIKSPQPPTPRHTNAMILKRTIIQLTDLSVMLSVASHSTSNDDGINLRRNSILLICVLLTIKAYAQSMLYSKVVRRSLVIMELISKLAVLRALTISTSFGAMIDGSSSILSITWVVWVMTQSSYNPTAQLGRDDCGHSDNDRVDVVFLGHPSFLSDSWALWLLPYSLKERWQAPFWAAPLWPIHYFVGWYVCNWGVDHFLGDDCRYDQVRMQNWVAPHFGRHFVTHPHQVRENIEACARHAEKIEVRVLCLGALNKAESINGGGWGVGRALGPNRRLSIIHGNHLTAAAVVETIYRCFGDRETKMFLTGASSKVGWAVARALRDRYGYDVLCHSTDPGRRRHFEQNGFASASTLAEGSAYCRHWIVGKYDTEVSKAIPQGAVAIVFSVPHPLQGRRDVRVIEAGTLHMDLSRLEKPRLFANKLREHEIFACHAAAFVAADRLDRLNLARIDEVGPVDPHEMDGWLADAQKLGFVVPHVEPVPESDTNSLADDKPPVVIVGSGPSGLSVAAYLSQTQVPHIVLEAEQNPDLFGSWGHHFSGLEITTHKKWCELPGLHMSEKDFPNEYVTAEEYQRYLKHYVHRFAINIQRGAKVTSIERGTDRSPYIVKYGENDAVDAWAVVVASGKHRIPQKNTSDNIALKLKSNGIPHIHSSELCDDAIWRQAIQAAQKGRLCMIGFGNSVADLVNIILQQCHNNCNGDSPRIHIAARTVPPVFPRQINFLRVDSIGYLVRALPCFLQDMLVKGLRWVLPDSRICNSAFPSHLQRWKQIGGRVPVIDKYGLLAMGFQSGSLVGHGPIFDITKDKVVQFNDKPTPSNGSSSSSESLISSGVTIDMVILATGYKEDCVIEREDRLNGLYKCGFGNSDRFLPLRTICEDAKYIADDISKSYTK